MIVRRFQSLSVCDRDVGADLLRLSRLFLNVMPQPFHSKLGSPQFRPRLGGLKRSYRTSKVKATLLSSLGVAGSAGRADARCGVGLTLSNLFWLCFDLKKTGLMSRRPGKRCYTLDIDLHFPAPRTGIHTMTCSDLCRLELAVTPQTYRRNLTLGLLFPHAGKVRQKFRPLNILTKFPPWLHEIPKTKTMSTSAANNAYIALTPNHADFMVPHSDRAPEGSAGHHRLVSDVDFELGGQEPKWRTMLGKAKEMVENNIGLLCVIASMAFFAMMDVAVKKLHNIDPPVSTLQLVAVRMGITYICCLIYVVSVGIPDPLLGPKGVRLLLVFRGLSGFFSLFCIYYSLKYLSLADATVLTFLAPFCTGVAGALFLKEDFTRKEAFASLFSLCGVVLIARPVFLFGDNSGAPDSMSTGSGDGLQLDSSEKGTPTERLIAVGVALVGVLGSTGAYTSLRAIGKRAHTLHSIMAFSIASISISMPTMIATHTPFIIPTRVEWLLLFLMVGTFGFIAQVFLAMGLQRETAGRGSMGAYTQVIFAVILEQIFFKTTPSILSVIGTLIIMTSALYVAVTKAQPQKAGSNSISLETIREDSLEEGLLEGTKHEEDSKSPSLSPLDRDFTSPKTAST